MVDQSQKGHRGPPAFDVARGSGPAEERWRVDATSGRRHGRAEEGDLRGRDDDESALRAAQHPSVAEFVDDALGSPPARDTGAEESKAPGFVPSDAPYVTAEQELYRRALDESARLERREEERDRRRPSGCLSNPVGWCLDATSPL